MSESLINQENKTFDPQKQWSLALDNQQQILGNKIHATADRFSSSISSWEDHAVTRSLFHPVKKIEEDSLLQPVNSSDKANEAFFVRIKIKMFEIKSRLEKAFNRIKKVIRNPVDSISSLFNGSQSQKSETKAKTKIQVASKQANASQKIGSLEKKLEEAPAPVNHVTPKHFEEKRVEEVEGMLAAYHNELESVGADNMKKMVEMVCKICILVGSLRGRWNHKEIEEYMKHMEVAVSKKIKSMDGGRFWNWVTIGVQLAGVGLSFAPLWNNPSGFPNAGSLLETLGKSGSTVSQFGSATSKIGEMDDQKRAMLRTQYEHDGEKIKTHREHMVGTGEKIHQAAQQQFEMWRGIQQADNAAKRAVVAA